MIYFQKVHFSRPKRVNRIHRVQDRILSKILKRIGKSFQGIVERGKLIDNLREDFPFFISFYHISIFTSNASYSWELKKILFDDSSEWFTCHHNY